MTSPKHLWSGDWERESADADDEFAALTPPPAPPTTPPSADGPEGPADNNRRRNRTRLIVAGTAVVLLLAVGITLAATLGGSSTPAQQAQAPATTPTVQANPGGSSGGIYTNPSPQSQTPTIQTQTAPQTLPAPVTMGPTVNWLGMQIVGTGAGVVIETVGEGSPAEAAGFEPGDVIQSIGNTPIGSVDQLRTVAKTLKLGQPFQLEVNRGSTQVTAPVTMTGLPTLQP
jgi:membrane-associated protease RseP (regulator of RpoE activity)